MESTCIIDFLGNKEWYNADRKLHREGGLPAGEYYYGSTYWCINGKLHREDGPAMILESGTIGWYLDHNEYKRPQEMPLSLFLAYCKWEYKKHGKYLYNK